MSNPVKKALAALTRVPGVRAAMVVDAEAGVPVAAQLATEVTETALAAMSGSLFARMADASQSAGLGTLATIQLEGENGHLVVSGAGALLVVALTEPDARLGLVRVQARGAAEELTR